MKYREDQYYIEQVLKGNNRVYRQLVDKHKDLVFTIVKRIVIRREEAEEVAQDVFVKAFEKLPDFRGTAKFSTWLYRIAYNSAISYTRKKKIEFLPAEEQEIENYSEDELSNSIMGLSLTEQKKLINNALAVLPGTDSLMVMLYYFHEKGIDEISEIIGMTPGNVKVKLHRIRKHLLKEMNELLGNDINTVA
jgi:RNA polymerase sigma-70 factor (ECF subfamily)